MVKMEKTKDIIQALRTKYSAPIYAFLTNVGNSTGYACNRYADAIAMCLWESRGLEIIGFEIKVSRTDWLKEMKKPSKADPIANYCDSWYLVLGDKDILRFGELPMSWGLMVPHTKSELKVVKESKRNLKPKPLDKNFVAAVLRRTTEQLLPDSQLRGEYNRGYEEGEKTGKESAKDKLEWEKRRIKQLEKNIDDFEKASGIRINDMWQKPNKIGEAVKSVLDGSYMNELKLLEDLQRRAQSCVESIEIEIKKHKDLKI